MFAKWLKQTTTVLAMVGATAITATGLWIAWSLVMAVAAATILPQPKGPERVLFLVTVHQEQTWFTPGVHREYEVLGWSTTDQQQKTTGDIVRGRRTAVNAAAVMQAARDAGVDVSRVREVKKK